MTTSTKVRELEYHRNGVGGAAFFVAIVEHIEDGVRKEMLVVRFDREDDKKCGAIMCAAFDLALLDKRNIKFGENSWRGDEFSLIVDAAIARGMGCNTQKS